ncbi:hypothetical protein [Nocardia sp. CNY236]|uniref:hypothetical protein n=1 Tax=Nocardia sp. CNY236 TaxID=1169152 RepID=UPI00040BAF24|nr:hypothetical protein [Nocardia sp. CNY236]
MNITHLAAAGVAAIAIAAPTAQAQPVIPVAHHVTCFIEAGGPYKAANAASAPIGFGYSVHCTPTGPSRRHIEVILWRHDLERDQYYLQAIAGDKDPTQAEKSENFFSECSTAGRLYGYHTQAILWAEHGNDMDVEDNSDQVILAC